MLRFSYTGSGLPWECIGKLSIKQQEQDIWQQKEVTHQREEGGRIGFGLTGTAREAEND